MSQIISHPKKAKNTLSENLGFFSEGHESSESSVEYPSTHLTVIAFDGTPS